MVAFVITRETGQYNVLGGFGMMVAAVVEENETAGRVEEGLARKAV